MKCQVSGVAVLAVLCVAFSFSPVEGTIEPPQLPEFLNFTFPNFTGSSPFSGLSLPSLSDLPGPWRWFSSEEYPNVTLPEECGVRFSESSGDNVPDSDQAGSDSQLTVGSNFPGLDSVVPDGLGSDYRWPWVVRIGDHAAGVLISPHHVITPTHCLANFTRWFGGYYTILVNIMDQDVEVAKVTPQSTEDNPLPLALLTLKSHNLTRVTSPVCIGPYRPDLIAAAVDWNNSSKAVENPVSIYRSGQCENHLFGHYKDDLMLCGAAAATSCGAPLLQLSVGRWMLVALGAGDAPPVARYALLHPARKWLEQL